ncbi:MAG: hypothetical protein R3197_17150 [Paracoccaceae bacterium]|jgi:hypothetical protein|nr:hypothetical protein [Paracoccaceae bacterium]
MALPVGSLDHDRQQIMPIQPAKSDRHHRKPLLDDSCNTAEPVILGAKNEIMCQRIASIMCNACKAYSGRSA